MPKEFGSPGNHCSWPAKILPLCSNLPKGAENTTFLQHSDHPLPRHTFGLEQQLLLGNHISKSVQNLKVSLWCLWPDFGRSLAINMHAEWALSQDSGAHVWLLSYFWKPAWLHKTYSLAFGCFPAYYVVSCETHKPRVTLELKNQ